MVEPRHAHILVIAPGSAPAAVVERALIKLADERRQPDEIHVLAVRERLAVIQRDLLSNDRGGSRFSEICRGAGISRDEVLFNQRTLHAVDVDLQPAATEVVERIVELLRSVASAEGVAVTVVIAEDAGWAGHLLHAALPVVAKGTDRLLIDVCGNGTRRRSSRRGGAAPRHFEVPFVLWPATEPQPESFRDAVERRRLEHRRIARPDVLRLDCRTRTLSVGDTVITLPAMQFFWVYYLALAPGERFPLAELVSLPSGNRRPAAHLTQKLSDGRIRTFPGDLQRAFAELFPLALDKFDDMYRRCCGAQPGMPSTISKINSALRRALGGGAAPYLIQGGRGAGGYRMTLPAAAIQIVGIDGKRA